MLQDRRQAAQQLAQLAADHLANGGSMTVCPPGSAMRADGAKQPSARRPAGAVARPPRDPVEV